MNMSNFYLLYGEDNAVIDNEINKIIKKLNIKDIIKYSFDSTDVETVLEDASTISMFAPKKIIILEDCNFFKANKTIDKIELLENYLEHYNPNSYLIFIINSEKIDTRKKIYKELKKNALIVECKKGDNNYLINYVEEYLKENSYNLEDINYFLKQVGNNIDNIKNELDKLFMYKLADKNITNADIDKITIKDMENDIFELTDAIIARDINKSLMLLEEFLNKNYDEIQIIMLLASQFRFLFQVKRLMNKNKRYDEIAKILEVNPYRVKFTIKKLYSYSETMLLEYIKKLAQMDQNIKLGLMNKRLALELFIIKREDNYELNY